MSKPLFESINEKASVMPGDWTEDLFEYVKSHRIANAERLDSRILVAIAMSASQTWRHLLLNATNGAELVNILDTAVVSLEQNRRNRESHVNQRIHRAAFANEDIVF